MTASTRVRLLVLLTCPLALAPAWAQDTAGIAVKVEDAGSNAEEMATFKATLERFASRMVELHGDVKDIVRQRESLERADLDASYEALLADLENDDRALRATSIRRFETFLDKYPNQVHTPHVMFRLAELYFEDAEEAWTVSEKEYRRLIEQLSDEDLENAPEEPKKDYRRSIRLYERIIRDYPEYEYIDGCYYMLGYVLSEPGAAQFDEEKGLAFFQTLVTTHADSRFAAMGHLRIGEYYFDYAQGADDLRKAIPHYEQVVALEGKNGKLYDAGLYKLAWSYYKLSEYDQALALLNELLDWSATVYFDRTGKRSAMEPEAVEYTAISFSDIAERQQKDPLAVAQGFYEKVGDREFENKVFKRLADVLTQQARYKDAIAVYEYIQQRWPTDAENPDLQWKIGTLYMSLADPDPQAAQNAVAMLNERYNDDSAWWAANRNNPDALAIARNYIEQSLAAVAIQYHTAALESGSTEDFGRAADLYGQYLTKFPFAEDYYQIQWWLADTLYKSGRLTEAEAQYLQLLKGGEHNYKEGSLWMVMQIRRQQLIDRYGSFDRAPEDAVVEKVVTLASGRERTVYKLSDQHAGFIAVCDELVASDFRAAEARIQDQIAATTDADKRQNLQTELDQLQAYASGLDQFRMALAYLPAQILFYHGRFAEARPRLEAIIERWPRRNEAAYSASLMVDSYLDEEDLEKVRFYSLKYNREGPFGEPEVAGVKNMEHMTRAEQATFKLAMAHIDQGDRLAAAEAFLAFIDEFPASRYRKDALYNAANSYEIVGRVDEAIRLFEQYVKENPEDEKSRPLYFRLAGNYASALELDKAVQYYEALYDNTKGKGEPYADAPAALFNAGFLRIGLGDQRQAARNFERYARENPEQPDAEQVLFMAGDQWELVGDQQALRFYRDYVRDFPDTNPDHVMEAYHRIAELTERTGTPRQVDQAGDDLLTAYNRLAPSGKVGSAGRHYAANAEFRRLYADLEPFKEIKFTANDDKNADLLLNVKKNALTELVARSEQIVTAYQDFEFSSAALYVAGVAYLAYSDMLFQAPCPKGFDEEACLFYAEQIDELRIPVEDKGRARLEATLTTAREQKDWSEWQSKALEELNRRYPLEFAKEKQEIRGESDSNLVPTAGPISVRMSAVTAGTSSTPPQPAGSGEGSP